MRVFSPKNTLSKSFRNEFPTLNPIMNHFPPLTNQLDPAVTCQINLEWINIVHTDFSKTISHEDEEDPETFWFKVREYDEFKNLGQFSLQCMCLSTSNASSERVWSVYFRTKNQFKGKQYFATTRAMLLSAEYVKNVGGLLNFEPTNEMFVRMVLNLNDKIIDLHKIDSCDEYMGEKLSEEYLLQCNNIEAKYQKFIKKN